MLRGFKFIPIVARVLYPRGLLEDGFSMDDLKDKLESWGLWKKD